MADELNVLVACESSGRVRSAFRAMGHKAWSCDVLPAEDGGEHIQKDVRDVLEDGWDLMIAHPPCTHLAVSGARHFKTKATQQEEALDFVRCLLNAPIEKIVVENPVSVISSKIRKPDQIIHPWMFGHPEKKTTCLWLKNVPPLKAATDLRSVMDTLPKSVTDRIHRMPPGPDRWKERSRTYHGIAWAMATQWGWT